MFLNATQALDNDQYYAMLDSIAGWTFVSGLKPGLPDSICENKVCPAGAKTSFVLNMKNGLPYLSKELFWKAMEDIARKAKVISGHKWSELKNMLDNRRTASSVCGQDSCYP